MMSSWSKWFRFTQFAIYFSYLKWNWSYHVQDMDFEIPGNGSNFRPLTIFQKRKLKRECVKKMSRELQIMKIFVSTLFVRRAGLLWSQQDFERRWSVPLFKCLTVLEFSLILFDLCLLITFFNFIMNYVHIVTFWIFTYHKIWIMSIMFCFIWSYWIIYFLACLEVSWRVVS